MNILENNLVDNNLLGKFENRVPPIEHHKPATECIKTEKMFATFRPQVLV